MSLPPRPPRVSTLAPGIRRIIAENPSPMTYWGTNTYLVGTGRIAVIDPGPAAGDQVDLILDTLEPGEEISHILITHAHLDHSPGAAHLAARCGAPVLAFGDYRSGRSRIMSDLAAKGELSGGEGVDHGFVPDRRLSHGELVSEETWSLEALWTPGHFGNHMSFASRAHGALFCGDLVMGWSSSLVSPPDGDLAAFLASLAQLVERSETIYFPGHGEPITDPASRISELVAHRLMRSRQIRTALAEAPGDATDLAARIYTDVPETLLPAAARNTLAHLIDMASKNEATYDGALTAHSEFRLAER